MSQKRHITFLLNHICSRGVRFCSEIKLRPQGDMAYSELCRHWISCVGVTLARNPQKKGTVTDHLVSQRS